MLDCQNALLVVIDVQGKLAQLMHEKEAFFENIEILIKAVQTLEIPIIRCEQNPAALGPTIEQIDDLLSENAAVEKLSFSCCGEKKFTDQLKQNSREQIILCGIEAHVCVYQTAMDLLNNGYDVSVVADAVSSRTDENKKIAIQRMTSEGAKLYSTEMLLFELLKTAEHLKFKEIAKLIK